MADAPGPDAAGGAPITTIVTHPDAVTANTTASFTFTASIAGSTFECNLDSTSFLSCLTPKTYTDLKAGAHTLQVRATKDGLTGASVMWAWTIDTTGVSITNLVCPVAKITATSASISFGASKTGATFSCNLDGAAASCTSPKSYTGLSVGAHTWNVVATDSAGNKSAPGNCAWEVIGAAPVTTVVCPAVLTNKSSVTVSFTADIGGTVFNCTLDGGAAAKCSSPDILTGLTDAAHTFTVIGTANGATEPEAHECRFTVDTIPPTIEILSGPAEGGTVGPTAKFTYKTNDGKTFVCSLNGVEKACDASGVTFDSLKVGDMYKFQVVTTDAAGNVSLPAIRNFKVGSGPPVVVTIVPDSLEGPVDGPTVGPDGNFVYHTDGGEAGVAYSACKLDGADTATCSTPPAPIRYLGLKTGPHTFSISGNYTNAPGTDTTVINVKFDVDADGPNIQPDKPRKDPAMYGWERINVPFPRTYLPTFRFSTVPFEAGRYNCTIDGKSVDPCEPDVEVEVGNLVDLHGGAPPQFPKFTENPNNPEDPTWVPDPYWNQHVAQIDGTDLYNNSGGEQRYKFQVDLVGPRAILFDTGPGVGEMTGTSCPSTSDGQDNAFTWHVPAANPYPDTTLTETPVRFKCLLDEVLINPFTQTNLVDCTDVDTLRTGQWAWGNGAQPNGLPLSDGPHFMTVIAFDKYNNPGPVRKIQNTIVWGERRDWIVDREPPTVTFDTLPDVNNPTGVNGTLFLTAYDNPETSTHGVVFTDCVLNDGGTHSCDSLPVSLGENRYSIPFHNLKDEQTLGGLNPNKVVLSAQDRCGSINAIPPDELPTKLWTVDSTPDSIAFDSLTNTTQVGTYPADLASNGNGTLNIKLFDSRSNDPTTGNTSVETQPTVTCTKTAGPGASTLGACSLVGPAPADGENWNYRAIFNTPLQGPANGTVSSTFTARVDTLDQYGNGNSTSISWTMDVNPPSVVFDTTPQVSDCAVNGTPLSKAVGDIFFTSGDLHGIGTTFTCDILFATNGTTVASVYPSGGYSGDCQNGGPTNSYHFPFTGLKDGTSYRLRVTATDRVGNRTIALRDPWAVDDSNPTVASFTPFRNSNDQWAAIASLPGTSGGDTTVNGTFVVSDVFEATNHPIVWRCFFDGDQTTGVDCSGPGYAYPISTTGVGGLTQTEGWHVVRVRGTDCVGNMTNGGAFGSLPLRNFYLDKTAPSVTFNVGPGTGTNNGVVTDPNGNTTVTLTSTDPGTGYDANTANGTNIQTVTCRLDGIGSLANCDTLADSWGTATFAFPTSAFDSLNKSAVVHLGHLSAGPHRLEFQVTDHWNHATALATVDFLINFGAAGTTDYSRDGSLYGHIFAIADDFSELNENGSPITDARILANAVRAGHARTFNRARKLRVGIVTFNGVASGTGHDDAKSAICFGFKTLLGLSDNCFASPNNSTAVQFVDRPLPLPPTGANLYEAAIGVDVLVIADVDDTGGAVQTAFASLNGGAGLGSWNGEIQRFAEYGGVVTEISGLNQNNTDSEATLTADSLKGLLDVQTVLAGRLASFAECNSTDPLAYLDGSTWLWNPRFFGVGTQPPLTTALLNNERDLGNNPANAGLNLDTNEVYEVNVLGELQDFSRPGAIDKWYPKRKTLGPVYVQVNAYSRRTGGVAGVGDGMAVFQRSGATGASGVPDLIACRTHPDGSISHDVDRDSIVSVPWQTLADSSFDFVMTTLRDLNLYESVIIGPTKQLFNDTTVNIALPPAPPQFNQVNCASGNPGASAPCRWIISSGCRDSYSEVFVQAGYNFETNTTMTAATITYGDECATDIQSGLVTLVAEAVYADTVVRYATVTAVPAPNGNGIWDPAWVPSQMQVNDATISIQTTTPSLPSDVGSKIARVDLGSGGVYHPEGFFIQPDTIVGFSNEPTYPFLQSFFNPYQYADAITSFRSTLRVQYSSNDGSHTSWNLYAREQNLSSVKQNETVSIASTDYLPRITDVTIGGDTAVKFNIENIAWGTQASSALSKADGGFVYFDPPRIGCDGVAPHFEVLFDPARTDSSSFPLAIIPSLSSLPTPYDTWCFDYSTGTTRPIFASFIGDSNSDPLDTHRSFIDRLYTFTGKNPDFSNLNERSAPQISNCPSPDSSVAMPISQVVEGAGTELRMSAFGESASCFIIAKR